MRALIRRALLAALLIPAFCALPAWGGEDATKDPKTWLDLRTSELIGKKVASPDGKALGEIEDMIVDVRRGAVQHVVLSFGGVADVGDKLFVFPVNAFKRDENRDRIVVNVQPEQLKRSRGFDRSNWPFDPPLARASKLRGKNVKDARGKAVGEIEDLEVNLGTGRIGRVWLAQDGRKGPEDKRALPLAAFSISGERGEEVVLRR
jgi:sporulation protein YlmC with PRC-barrel domain